MEPLEKGYRVLVATCRNVDQQSQHSVKKKEEKVGMGTKNHYNRKLMTPVDSLLSWHAYKEDFAC